MKRLNIIFIADEGESQQASVLDTMNQIDVSDQVNILNQMLSANPSLAEDPAMKEILKTSEAMKAEEAAVVATGGKQQQQASNESNLESGKETVDTAKEKSPLSSLPFFKEDGSTEEKIDFDKLTPENFHEVAAKYGIDIEKPNWVGETMKKVSEQFAPQNTSSKFETEYNELKESILALPKEVQSVVNAAIEGKDWRSALGGASSLDYAKDFSTLSADEKIKIHNYYFPEDTIKTGEDITSKENSKALRAAEANYKADKTLVETKIATDRQNRENSTKSFQSSVDNSISELKKEYPDFKEKDLKIAEEIVRSGGIYNQFFDKAGNLSKDGFKKLIFALHGENILKVATSIAENRGKSAGKADVLSVEQKANKNNNQGVTELTDVEKKMTKLLSESSMTGSQLTY